MAQAGKHQKIQRRFGIAQRADDAGQRIIEDRHRDAPEDNHNIIIGLVENIVGGIRPNQNVFAQYHGQYRQHHRKANADPEHIAHIAPKPLIVLLSELLGHGNRKAGTHADAEAQHQKVHGACGTDAGQRIHAQHLAHDHGVHHAVKLLE